MSYGPCLSFCVTGNIVYLFTVYQCKFTVINIQLWVNPLHYLAGQLIWSTLSITELSSPGHFRHGEHFPVLR